MKAILVIVLVLAFLDVSAQKHLIGIAGGTNWTNIASNIILKGTDYRRGLSAGITYEYYLKERLSIGADLTYTQKGFRAYIKTPTGEAITEKSNYDYLSVPLKVGFYHFHLGSKIFGFAKIGLTPSLLINAKITIPTFTESGSIAGMKTFDITNRVSKFDLGGLAEIGGGYKIINNIWLTATFIYQNSLTSITNTDYNANGKIRHNGISLNVGLKWALKKE